MSVLDVKELSPKEDDCLWEVVSYPIHTYPHLVTPGNQFRFGFGIDLGSFVFCFVFLF